MSEAVRQKRRPGRVLNGLAVLMVACISAAILALLVAGLVALFAQAAGGMDWHRNGYVRELVALWLAFMLPMLIPARRIGPTLIARYDDEALHAPPPNGPGMEWAGPQGEARRIAWDALHAWCFIGAGSGRSPICCPWAMPDVPRRFSIAVLTGIDGPGKSQLAQALCRELDGTPLLEACKGRLAGLRLRLGVKLAECVWWRSRQPLDPWDAGHLGENPARLQRLGQFLPRRATLIVADQLSADSLKRAIELLAARAPDFRHPVRLLILDAVLPASLDLRWDARRASWPTAVHELGDVPVVELFGARLTSSVSTTE